METARVDIRKLQLLNDRIAQAADALNQVRLSVYGLQHSALPASQLFGAPPLPGIPGYAAPAFNTFAPVPFAGPAGFAAQAPFGFPPGANWPGVSHTAPDLFDTGIYARYTDPWYMNRVAHSFPFAFSPFPAVA